MQNHHLKERISSRQKLAHDDLKQRLALQLFLFTGQLDAKLAHKGVDIIFLSILDGVKDPEDWVKNELVEGTL